MNPEPTKIVQELKPYVPGEQPRDMKYIKLNTNENPYPPAPGVFEAVKTAGLDRMRLYPDPLCKKLRGILSQKHGVETDRIFVGNGSDEVLRLLFQAYLSPGEILAITDPTYSLYPVLAATFGAGIESVPLEEEGQLPQIPDPSRFRVMVIASPNPPLGAVYSEEELEVLIKAAPSTLFIIDEAYVDFAESDCMDLSKRHENVAVCRTFSKSYSLAGIRVGYAVGCRGIIENLYKIKDSYNVNYLSQVAACAAVKAEEYYRQTASRIREDREFLAGELREMGLRVYPSQGNFIFAEGEDGRKIYEGLKAAGILVRYFDLPRLRRGVRITIGTRKEIEELLKALAGL